MTIELTANDLDEQFQEADEEQIQWDPLDELDVTYKFDARISQGWGREILLREGIQLNFHQHNLTDKWIVNAADSHSDRIWMCFMLSGQEEELLAAFPSKSAASSKAKRYNIRSNGLLNKKRTGFSDTEQHRRLYLQFQPEILCSFMNDSGRELPEVLQNLIKSPSEAAYGRGGDIQPSMNAVIQQITQCPYQGIVKRAYLEGKTIELIALVLDHEIAIQQGDVKQTVLNPEQIERIYYARELLLKDLINPPSLTKLAQQVGLSVSALGKGFRKVFDMTVFSQLQMHRLEIAKQLLSEKDTSVYEVAYLVGYASVHSFSKAFKQKFGVRPKDYQKACR
ncbi:MAG: AraC family transcriptional regulator [Cyanobacteria bacterium P01_A01_bin.17]